MKDGTNINLLDDPNRLAYSIPGTCEALGGVSRQFLYDLINSGRLKSFRVGARRFVSRQAILDFIADAEAASTSDGTADAA